jgi:hypothetical protein
MLLPPVVVRMKSPQPGVRMFRNQSSRSEVPFQLNKTGRKRLKMIIGFFWWTLSSVTERHKYTSYLSTQPT